MQGQYCSWCIVKPFQRIILGNRVFTARCNHQKPNHQVYYEVSKVLSGLHLIIFCFVCCVSYHLIKELVAAKNILDFKHRCYCAFFATMVVILEFLLVTPWTNKPGYINLTDKVVEKYTPLGILSLSQKEIKRVTAINRWVGYFLGVQLAALPFVYLFDYLATAQVDWLERIALYIAYYYFLVVILTSVCMLFVYLAILGNASRRFKILCMKRFQGVREGNFCKNVALFTEFYRELLKGVDIYITYLSSFLHVCLVGIILYIILENTVLVELIVNPDLNQAQMKSGIVVVLFGNAGPPCLFALMKFVDTLQDEGDALASFLFHSRISVLSEEEAAQVEVLLDALNIFRPLIRIANLFVVGTRLTATLSGIIVTYVLVVLQFFFYFS